MKTAFNTKVTEIKIKTSDTLNFITTLKFNRLMKISFDARIKEEAKPCK